VSLTVLAATMVSIQSPLHWSCPPEWSAWLAPTPAPEDTRRRITSTTRRTRLPEVEQIEQVTGVRLLTVGTGV
jgi:hypothetical protein